MELVNAKLIFEVLLSCLGTLCVFLFNRISQDLKRMTDSVEQLNIKVAVVCEKIENHDNRIKTLERKM